MRTALMVLALAVLTPATSTIYSGQGAGGTTADLAALAVEVARQEVEGRRVELDAGEAAPFDGVLLDDRGLEVVREEVDALREEVAELRLALAASREAAEIERGRAEVWQAEARGSGWQRATRALGLYGSAVCAGAGLALWAGDR